MFVQKQWNFYYFVIYMQKVSTVKPIKRATKQHLTGRSIESGEKYFLQHILLYILF